jgi:hypothetical protein
LTFRVPEFSGIVPVTLILGNVGFRTATAISL